MWCWEPDLLVCGGGLFWKLIGYWRASEILDPRVWALLVWLARLIALWILLCESVVKGVFIESLPPFPESWVALRSGPLGGRILGRGVFTELEALPGVL